MTTSAPNVADSSEAEIESALAGASRAADPLRVSVGLDRAGWLRAVGSSLAAARAELVDLAVVETHLPRAALDVELSRTVFQLEHFARTSESGAGVQVVVEHADPDYPVAPRPELVRADQPIGPVLVFTASNFPFAFSVAGNDTASALAAGCSVIVKANPGHPRLSVRTASVVAEALDRADAPAGTFGHLVGVAAGATALTDPRVKACGFTGSLTGGRALFDIASGRPDPIPFYGELGSVNPVFVTPAAAAARGAEIGAGFAGSVTGRAGQLCTKPGVLFAPAGSAVASAAAAAIGDPGPAALLTDRIAGAYQAGIGALAMLPGARVLSGGASTQPTLVAVSGDRLAASGIELAECFGPAAVVVEYDDPAQLADFAVRMGANLTATVHGEPDDEVAAALVPLLADRAGRLIWNGWPTGVAVTRAMHHGGPYPATTAPGFSSIGADAMRRWLRPVTYQNWPVDLLPAPVRAALGR